MSCSDNFEWHCEVCCSSYAGSVGDIYYEDTVHGGRLWAMHVVGRSKIRAEADLVGGEGGLGKRLMDEYSVSCHCTWIVIRTSH